VNPLEFILGLIILAGLLGAFDVFFGVDSNYQAKRRTRWGCACGCHTGRY